MPELPARRKRSMLQLGGSSKFPRKNLLGISPADFRLASLRLTPAKTAQHWCTGKDSNLRTSLGGTDLQSVGFNHSPTCANSRAMRPLRCLRQSASVCGTRKNRRPNAAQLKIQLSPNRETKARANCAAKITTRRKRSEWSAFGKTCCALLNPPPAEKISSFSGAGEGIRTPDPLITNQMLYRLSYASAGESAPPRKLIPPIPSRCPGQLNKLTQAEVAPQAKY
jgi:hypothetical protein